MTRKQHRLWDSLLFLGRRVCARELFSEGERATSASQALINRYFKKPAAFSFRAVGLRFYSSI
jgi:hypothetical protein